MSIKLDGNGIIGRDTENNITLNADGSVNFFSTIVGPGTPLFADENGKLPSKADKIIVSSLDPDPLQGHENWLWLKV